MGQGQSSIPAEELAALAELFEALRGNQWRRRDGWKAPTVDPEAWFGVRVALGHVVAVELPANELAGGLRGLRGLRAVQLAADESGTCCVADLQGDCRRPLSACRTCACSTCRGTKSAVRMRHKMRVSLDGCGIEGAGGAGEIPVGIGKLTALRRLDLSCNDFIGEPCCVEVAVST